MLLVCYYAARVTKSTGNKPGEKIVFTNLFVSTMPRKRNTDFNRKEPVRLRQRRVKNGGYSLYLDTCFKLTSEVVNQGSVQVQHSPTSTEFVQR